MSEMVERMAKAICDAHGAYLWDSANEFMRAAFRDQTRAAIKVMREPTEAMILAAAGGGQSYEDAWKSMIDEALK